MQGSGRDFGGPKPCQGPRKLHQHEIFFQLSVFYEGSSSAFGGVNRLGMLGMLNTLPLSLLRYGVENRLTFFFASLHHRHRSILRGELGEGRSTEVLRLRPESCSLGWGRRKSGPNFSSNCPVIFAVGVRVDRCCLKPRVTQTFLPDSSRNFHLVEHGRRPVPERVQPKSPFVRDPQNIEDGVKLVTHYVGVVKGCTSAVQEQLLRASASPKYIPSSSPRSTLDPICHSSTPAGLQTDTWQWSERRQTPIEFPPSCRDKARASARRHLRLRFPSSCS